MKDLIFCYIKSANLRFGEDQHNDSGKLSDGYACNDTASGYVQ